MKLFNITVWLLIIASWACLVWYGDRITEQNKQIMAKVEHLEAVMLCNPIDLTGDFGTKPLNSNNYTKKRKD